MKIVSLLLIFSSFFASFPAHADDPTPSPTPSALQAAVDSALLLASPEMQLRILQGIGDVDKVAEKMQQLMGSASHGFMPPELVQPSDIMPVFVQEKSFAALALLTYTAGSGGMLEEPSLGEHLARCKIQFADKAVWSRHVWDAEALEAGLDYRLHGRELRLNAPKLLKKSASRMMTHQTVVAILIDAAMAAGSSKCGAFAALSATDRQTAIKEILSGFFTAMHN